MRRRALWTIFLSLAFAPAGCGIAPGATLGFDGQSGFQSASTGQGTVTGPLATILSQDRQLAASHQHPIVIFDLDDTLFCTAYRNLEILKEWGATAAGAPYLAQIDALTPADVSYDITGALTQMGMSASQESAVQRFWTTRFFSGAYVGYDHPEPGAAAYVQAVATSGAEVVYMTGRSAAMESGTQQALVADGFPWDPADGATELILKSTRGQSDAQFKGAQTQTLEQNGTIVGCFDNEPANVNMFQQVAPQATVVFLNTVHSPNAPEVNSGIAQIDSFATP